MISMFFVVPVYLQDDADRRTRHGLDALDHYYLCDQEDETIDHIVAS